MGPLCHQRVNIFHLVGVLASVKQLRKCASDVLWVLQRGAKAEVMGEGSAMEGPIGSCLVIIVFGKRSHHSGLASRQLGGEGRGLGGNLGAGLAAEVKSLVRQTTFSRSLCQSDRQLVLPDGTEPGRPASERS